MIYHIAEQAVWDAQQSAEHYRPDEFVNEGFVHCSDLNQVANTAER